MTGTSSEETSNNETVASPNKKTQASNSSHLPSPSKKDIDIATQALNHFAQGKRHLLVHDISSAVNSLQEACRLLAEHHGETAPECGDAYFYYGKALLELARIENGVLGYALDGEEGSTEDEDKDDDDDDEEEDKEGDSQEEGEANEAAQENGDASGEPEGEKMEESEEDDVSNLQLAWEMLELSKVIYTKQLEGNPSMNLKIAQVYLKLGEVGLESENYPQSIKDLQQCLDIMVKELKADDRCLAETHYQMGVAFSFSDDFDKAIGSFTSAAKVIQDRMANLEKQRKEKEAWTEEQRKKDALERKDPFYTEQAEIEELANLLPEIKEKIVDMEEMKKDSKEKLQKMKEMTFASVLGGAKVASSSKSGGESSIGFSDAKGIDSVKSATVKPATSITHLVRKKRKPEEDADKDDAAKKAKGEKGQELKPTTSLNGEKVENGSPSTVRKVENGSPPTVRKVENGSPSTETPKELKAKDVPETAPVKVSEKKQELTST